MCQNNTVADPIMEECAENNTVADPIMEKGAENNTVESVEITL